MSGYHDQQKSPYIDEAVLGSSMLNWAFENVTPDDSGPVMAPLPHHRPPVHRQQYHHHPGLAQPPPSGFIRQPSAHHHPPRQAHRPPPAYPPNSSPITSLPPPPQQLPQPPQQLPPPPPPFRGSPQVAPQASFPSGVANPARPPPSYAPSGSPPSNQNSTCQYCGKTYSRPDYLSTHIAGKHSGRKMWNCKICGKEYKWRSSLSHHQKTAHQHQRPEGGRPSSSPRAQTKPSHVRRESQH